MPLPKASKETVDFTRAPLSFPPNMEVKTEYLIRRGNHKDTSRTYMAVSGSKETTMKSRIQNKEIFEINAKPKELVKLSEHGFIQSEISRQLEGGEDSYAEKGSTIKTNKSKLEESDDEDYFILQNQSSSKKQKTSKKVSGKEELEIFTNKQILKKEQQTKEEKNGNQKMTQLHIMKLETKFYQQD